MAGSFSSKSRSIKIFYLVDPESFRCGLIFGEQELPLFLLEI